jgi:hypothetical protein
MVQVGLLLLAGVLVVGSVGIARVGLTAAPSTPFTELWLLPVEDGRTAQLGIANHEGREVTYRALVTLDGRPVADIASISVADATSDIRALPVPVDAPEGAQLEVRLWRDAGERTGEPYRVVRLTIGSAEEAAR